MKSSIGNVWITGLVITFMLIFTGYLAVTINYSSAIKNKNYILSIIEKKNGITNDSSPITKPSSLRSSKNVYTAYGTLQTINLFLRGSAYKQQGICGEGRGDARGVDSDIQSIQWYGVTDLYNYEIGTNGTLQVKYEQVNQNSKVKYYYCFAKVKIYNTNEAGNYPAYYRIRLFYALDLPILDSLVFTIDGRTSIIEKPRTDEVFHN